MNTYHVPGTDLGACSFVITKQGPAFLQRETIEYPFS